MKKIFLSSGVVICMLCPAFATDPTGIPASNGVAYNDPTNNCIESVLGASSGAVSLRANWQPVCSGGITLDSKRYTSASDNTGTASNPTTSPSTLYSKYETGVYSVAGCTTAVEQVTVPAQTGYTFNGFYTSKYTGGTQVISNTGAVLPAANTQVTTAGGTAVWYAQWKANETTINYQCGNETENYSGPITGTAPSANAATYNSNFAFQSNSNCAKEGYTFTGWDCAGLSGVQTAGGAGATWTYTGADGGSITCTAHFNANNITLNWNANGGTATGGTAYNVPSESETCMYDGAIVLPPEPERVGYTFNGWKVNNNNNS